MCNFNEEFLFDRLQKTEKKIFIYGMGNGAEKLNLLLNKYNIVLSGIFASDEYVRGHSFLGHTVKKYSEIPKDSIILLAFGAFTKDLFEKFIQMEKEHEFYAPDMPLFGYDFFKPCQLSDNKEEIKRAYSLLGDELSKKVFENTILFKISGKLKYLREIETSREEIFNNLIILNDEESYLDLGAYDGDTVREFQNLTNGKYKKIIAVEPDIKNFKKLINKTDDALLLNLGVHSFNGELSFLTQGSRNSFFDSKGKNAIEVKTIDEICKDFDVSYIKMDVEGSEHYALKGAKDTLLYKKPKMIVSAYHKNLDFFSLINTINDINPAYKIYLRHQPYFPNWETNIIAV